jgi:ribosome-binding ATPase
MKVALTGLPLAGKTCLFNALTEGAVDSVANPARADRPSAAMIALPDDRLDWLSEHYKTQKRTPVQMEWIDLPGLAPSLADLASQNTAITEHLRRSDLLVNVLRAFDSSLTGKADPKADRDRLRGEFLLSDLDTVLRRIEKIEKQITKPVPDRDALKRELDFMGRCREAIEAERPLHEIVNTDVERGILRGFTALTEKPSTTVLNVGEDHAGDPESVAAAQAGLGQPLIALCASLEAEIAQLPAADRATFMGEMGLARLHTTDLLHAVYAALGRITYFTAGEKEVAARSIRKGADAVESAEEVHSDIARGFIRAEVVTYEDFRRCGSLKEARAQGHYRLEGRAYVVQDGDIMLFHFSR